LAYLVSRERADQDDREIRTFKQRMIAAHPERGKEIEAMFADTDTDLAPALSEEEMEEAGPLSINEIEAALQALKETGFAVQDVD
jgi:hypothetical protein